MDENPPRPPPAAPRCLLVKVKALWPQYVAAYIVSLLNNSFFLIIHTNSNMYYNNIEPSEWNMEEIELSSFFTAILSFPLFAFLFEKLSRKICACIISAIFIFAFIITMNAKSHILMQVAHCVSAIGGTGVVFICTIYVTEIAQDDIRGSLLVFGQLLFNATAVTVFIYERYILETSFPWIAIVPPVAAILCFAFWLPETPVYFLRRGNREGATRSLQWLCRGDTTENLAKKVDDLEEVLKATRSVTATYSSVFHELFNRCSLKYSGIALVLYFMNEFSGFRGTMSILFTVPFKLERYSKFYTVYILSLVARLAGNFPPFLLCDKKGRRTMLLLSAVVCSISLIPIAICSHVMTDENEISAEKVFAIMFSLIYQFSFNMGFSTVIIVVLADIFPPKILVIQIVVMGIVRVLFNIADEYYIYPYPWEINTLRPGLFWTHSVVCAAGALFIFKFLPETKRQPAGFLFMENTDNGLLTNM